MAAFNYTATRGLSLLGDEKGAWMADTTAETLVGAELVTNGDFPTSTTGWTAYSDATLSIDTARLKLVSDSGFTNGIASQTITTVIGKSYVLSVDITLGTSVSYAVWVDESTAIDATLYSSGSQTTSQTITTTFIATSTTTFINLVSVDDGAHTFFDNVTCRLAVPDLSANDNGLGVHGSITKAAVATGADLMAYSGFGTSNYLEQPYNSDLDFGTGDFCFMGWLKEDANTSADVIFCRADTSTSGGVIQAYITSAGILTFRISDDGLATTDSLIYTTALDDGEFHHIALARSGTNLYMYIDGTLVTSSTVTNASGSLSDTNAILRFGLNTDGASAMTYGSLCLWRINPGMTAAQIKSSYNKEKHLFSKHSYYTQEGVAYDLDVVLSVANKFVSTRKNTTVTLSGKTRAIVHREDTEWSITTDLLHRTDTSYVRVSEMEEFLYSTHGSEAFTMDLYGTSASPDELKSCIRVGSDGDFPRVAEQMLFRTSFKVQES